MTFKVTKSGWYRTRDGSDAEVVINRDGRVFIVVGYIVGNPDRQSWQINGYFGTAGESPYDLVEYLGKERPKDPKKYKTTVFLYADGRATLDGILCESHPLKPSPKVVKTQVIEWETKESMRVADYLVEITNPTPLYHLPFTHWLKQTHPIGSQPEGSVMVPGSERSQE